MRKELGNSGHPRAAPLLILRWGARPCGCERALQPPASEKVASHLLQRTQKARLLVLLALHIEPG